jgi:hypothetical protein
VIKRGVTNRLTVDSQAKGEIPDPTIDALALQRLVVLHVPKGEIGSRVECPRHVDRGVMKQ